MQSFCNIKHFQVIERMLIDVTMHGVHIFGKRLQATLSDVTHSADEFSAIRQSMDLVNRWGKGGVGHRFLSYRTST